MNNIKPIYLKITDKYIYFYGTTFEKYPSKYIKNGRVDNVYELIKYLNKLLNKRIVKNVYYIILDTLLNNSDLFVYKYVFDNIGVLNYKLIDDLDLIEKYLDDNNIIIMNWSSSINYAYKKNGEILIYPFNSNIIDSLNKQYILLCGDTPISNKLKTPIYNFEFKENNIFNFI